MTGSIINCNVWFSLEGDKGWKELIPDGVADGSRGWRIRGERRGFI